MDELNTLIEELNSSDKEVRRRACLTLGQAVRVGKVTRNSLQEVNNHVHTKYSFSPYEPERASFEAWRAGLGIVGSIDHDSISASEGMIEASRCWGIASTVGFELRAGFLDTPFAERKLNNPDSKGIAYMCVHGVPYSHIDECKAFLEPVHKARGIRNRAMVAAFNALGTGLELDYEADVLPLSRESEGGSVTERHILYALALKVMEKYQKGICLTDYLEYNLRLSIPEKILSYLQDENNPHYAYDLLGVFKSSFLPRFFIQPGTDECIDVRTVLDFSKKIGAIAAYAYLGDVTASPTGDKKAEKFEDDYLDELIPYLAAIGYPAVTYMPPRNTKEQMKRLQRLCRDNGLMEISGVDINSSRQKMNCPELLDPVCSHLVDSAWALVAHEKLSSADPAFGLFNPDNPVAKLPLEKKISVYSAIGRSLDHFCPEKSAAEKISLYRRYIGD